MNLNFLRFTVRVTFVSTLLVSCSSQNITPSAVQPTAPVIMPSSTAIPVTPTLEAPTASPTPELTLPARWIAFLNQDNIWLIHPDGSDITQVTKIESDDLRVESFKWSPDGNQLAYSLRSSSGSAIFLYDIPTAGTQMILKDDVGGGFDWSPTSKQIIYDTPGSGDIPSQMQNKGLRVITLENQKDRPAIKPSDDHPFITAPQWSSEGSHVLFTTPCFEISCTGQGVANYETGNSIMLPVNGGTCEWAPDDLRIACIRTVPDNTTGLDKAEVVVMDETGTIAKSFPLVEDPGLLALLKWSADGEALLLGYYADGKSQTDILSIETGKRQSLAPGLPSSSDEGHWILTWSGGIDVVPEISIVNTESGEVLPLTEGTTALWQP